MLFWGGRGAGAFAENFGSFVDNFVTLPAALLVISPLRTSGFKLRSDLQQCCWHWHWHWSRTQSWQLWHPGCSGGLTISLIERKSFETKTYYFSFFFSFGPKYYVL
jgi:hypothetical protein